MTDLTTGVLLLLIISAAINAWLAFQLSLSNDDNKRWRLRFDHQTRFLNRTQYTLKMVKDRVSTVLKDCT